MAISAKIENFVATLTAMLVPVLAPVKLSAPQLLRAYRRVRLASKVSDEWKNTLATEIKRRINAGETVEDKTGRATVIRPKYRTYSVEAAVMVLMDNQIDLASVLKVQNKAVEALPKHILAQIPYVEEVGERVHVTGEGMDER